MKSCCIRSTSLDFNVHVPLNYWLLLQLIMLVHVYMDMLTCQILVPALQSAAEIRVSADWLLRFSICSLVLLYMLDEVYASLIGCWHS